YKEVKIPFWSHANGMKDIVWYSPSRQADGSYTVTANVSDHENASGKYEAQLFYVDQQGRNTFVKKAFVDRAKPSADITISKNEVEGTFTITAKNLKGFEGYKEVKIPFWSQANGMKDIVWYSPSRQSDGSYTVTAKASDHENANGQYEAQLFYVDHKGQNTFVKKTFVQYEG
ncbi:GBS Bsp-like repeat-containing protein, partial [Streptococcus australis]